MWYSIRDSVCICLRSENAPPSTLYIWPYVKGTLELHTRVHELWFMRGLHELSLPSNATSLYYYSYSCMWGCFGFSRGELSYLALLGGENISAPYFKQCFFQGGLLPPQTVKNHASQSQERNNKYFILCIEFCINNKI